jgi:endogenous inhibitor of DNA gyrase (YacG/DUF329 family)
MIQSIDSQEIMEDPELIAVACIHCGKAVFKFSHNALRSTSYDGPMIVLKCPFCEKETTYDRLAGIF